MFAYEYSRTKDDIPQGTALVSEYGGRAELTAHFERQTIFGCIRCNGGLTVSGIGSMPDGETVGFADEYTPNPPTSRRLLVWLERPVQRPQRAGRSA